MYFFIIAHIPHAIIILIAIIITKFKDIKKYIQSIFSYKYVSLIVLSAILVIPPISLWNLLTNYSFDYNKLNLIGGTFGFLNPIVATLAALITYVAFYEQYRANEMVVKDRKKQDVINRFFEMLKIHKENVNELTAKEFAYEYNEHREKNGKWVCKTRKKIQSFNKGRISFACHLNTFNILFSCYEGFLKKKKQDKSIIQKITFVYNFFYIQNSDNESKEFKNYVKPYTKEYVEDEINQKEDEYYVCPNFQESLFSEHKTELNHYYRHLYMMVKYIDQIEDNILSYEEKRDLLRILRAQLTNKEQIMLFYNWLSNNGSQWEQKKDDSENNIKNSFFIKYRMIHNVSLEDFSFLDKKTNTLDKAKDFITLINSTCIESNLPGGENFKKIKNKEWDPVFEFEDILNRENVGFNYHQ